MIRQSINNSSRITWGITAVIGFLLFYTFISYQQHQKNPGDTTIPTWNQIASGIKKITTPNARSGEIWLWIDSKATTKRLFTGLALGASFAVVTGMTMGCFPRIEALLFPLLLLLAKVPPTAILAIFFVLFGTDLNMYIAMIGFGVMPALALSIALAIKEVPEELIFKAYTIGASHLEVVVKVIFYYVLPNIIDSIRLQIGPAMVYLIAAEMLCADEGMGFRIRLQSRLQYMDVVYPYLACLACFGFGMDFVLNRTKKAICRWAS